MEIMASLTVNAQHLQALLQQQQYDAAQLCMDERLALIARLAELAKIDPTQQQDIVAWANMQSAQEQELIKYAYSQHQAIFKQLTLLSKVNKAGRAYRINIQE